MAVIGSAAPFLFKANNNRRLHNYFPCITSNQLQQHSYLPPKPTTTLKSPPPYWASLQAEIETHLKHAIPLKEPLVVFEPMHHLVFSSPQTTMPALCLAACELVGGQRHQAMAAASALLLIHSATHTHEHLGPKPGPGPNYAPSIELLTGDGIVPFGFELLARCDDEGESSSSSERILRVMVEISRAVGSRGVIDAQYRKASNGGEVCHVEDIRSVVEKYEGELHGCGGACGAVLGGGSEDEIERLRKFGFYVGIIQGFLRRGLGMEDKEVQEARYLAFQELNFFKDSQNVDAISTFITSPIP